MGSANLELKVFIECLREDLHQTLDALIQVGQKEP
jgi:hypothetical protein